MSEAVRPDVHAVGREDGVLWQAGAFVELRPNDAAGQFSGVVHSGCREQGDVLSGEEPGNQPFGLAGGHLLGLSNQTKDDAGLFGVVRPLADILVSVPVL